MAGVGSFGGLNTALRGLLAEQRSLDVTGHNIGNVNTPGYSRQEAVLTATRPVTLPAGAEQDGSGAQLGQGVDVLEIRRSRDGFLDLQARAAQMDLGRHQAGATALSRAEDLLHEPGETGVASLLNSFWSAWQTLSSQPESAAAKAAVLGAGKDVAAAIGALSAGLTQLQAGAATEAAQLTSPAGPLQSGLQEIARLNAAIQAATQAGQQPNDLLDRRDVLLDGLSTYGQVSTTDAGSGVLDVAVDGQPIVAGSTFTWPATYTATSGRLGQLATLAGASGPLAAYRADLDAVAATLVSAVNALQPSGSPFFTGTDAASLAVAATANPTAGTGAAGANDLATALAALRGGAADDPYAALVQRMGADSAGAQRAKANAQAVATAAEERRQSVSGVSLDEEMTNLIRFQRGYQAAARVMSSMDEALDTLINRTGRVGL